MTPRGGCGNSRDVVVATGVHATRRHLRAATAVALASLLLVGNLLAYWHQATVSHARCAAHGELIHAGPAAHAAGAQAEPPASQAIDEAAGRLLARSWDAEGDHDHCQICPLTREPVRFEQRLVLVGPAATPVAVAAPPAAAPVAVAVDLVRMAPKTSPPV